MRALVKVFLLIDLVLAFNSFQMRHSRCHLSMQDIQHAAGDSLSRGRLRSILREKWVSLASSYRNEERATQDLLSRRLPQLELNRCYVHKSAIAGAGRGVFAKRDIMQGELVTFYPGDVVGIYLSDGKEKVLRKSDQSEVALRALRKRTHAYQMDVGQASRCFICGDPDLTEDPAYLGHMINDGSMCSDKASTKRYNLETNAMQNVAQFFIDGCHVAIVALRDISKDEELLISYGPQFWLAK